MFQQIYGGKFSNHEKARILKESPLIGVFKNVHIQAETMFGLKHQTIRHSPPNMQQTFGVLAVYMRKHNANVIVRGRSSAYCVPDAMRSGMNILMTKVPSNVRGEDDSVLEDAAADEDVEVEDGDDLEV